MIVCRGFGDVGDQVKRATGPSFRGSFLKYPSAVFGANPDPVVVVSSVKLCAKPDGNNPAAKVMGLTPISRILKLMLTIAPFVLVLLQARHTAAKCTVPDGVRLLVTTCWVPENIVFVTVSKPVALRNAGS